MEKSCGAIVFTKHDGQYLFIVVQEQSGSYSFPKGHMEGKETEIETARREIFEETGLKPTFLNRFRETDEYTLREKPGVRKQVVYFLAEYENESPSTQLGEIRSILLLPYEQAMRCFDYEGTRRVFASAYHFLTQE